MQQNKKKIEKKEKVITRRKEVVSRCTDPSQGLERAAEI
jgi:hypothetical protein